MTSRRALTGPGQRQSRALQFVPGHVHGRVASAQPVVRRATIGQASSATVTPPFLVTSSVTGFAPGVTYGVSEPPDPVWITGPLGGEFFFPAQGTAVVVFISHYDAGTMTIPSGWTVERTGSLNGLSWALVWATHLSGSLDNEVVFSDWDGATSRAVFVVIDYAMDDFLVVDPLPDWSYDLRSTTPSTASGAASHDIAQPLPSWGAATSLLALRSEGAPTYPYVVKDPDITMSGPLVDDNLGNDPQVGAIYPATDDDYLPLVANVNVSFNSGNGTFASMGIGWA